MIATGANSQGVTIGDVDNDGDLDIISTSRDDHRVQVFRNSGSGAFTQPTDTMIPLSVFPGEIHAVAIADGIVDVVFTAYDEVSEQLMVRMRGGGDGTFYNYSSIGVPGQKFDLGRINDDVSVDAVMPGGDKLTVYLSSVGQESFFPINSIESQAPFSNASAIVLGDFDDDGDLDVATAVFGNLYIGTNAGLGQFIFAAPLPFFGGPSDLAVGDVNDDGNLDILLSTLGGGSDAAHLFAGNGDGTFQSDVVLPAPTAPRAVAVGDINKDGIDDLAVVGGANIVVYLSTGDGFEPGKQVGCEGLNPKQLHLGDLNGDCVDDVVTVTESGVCVALSE
jgi:large repetitive protein